MAITDWTTDSRPRERLLSKGAAALSDAELLAIFLRTGISGRTAVDLGNYLLADFGSLANVLSANQKAFCDRPGLGPAKYAGLQAVLEMARRAVTQSLKKTSTLGSPEEVNAYLQYWMRDKPFEVFSVLFLDTQNRLIEAKELFRGTVSQTAVYPREVVRQAINANASSVILAHNHPSGCAEPSPADTRLTRVLKEALAIVDIQVLDHLIIAGPNHYSFAANGQL